MKSKALLWWGLAAGGVAVIALVLGLVWWLDRRRHLRLE